MKKIKKKGICMLIVIIVLMFIIINCMTGIGQAADEMTIEDFLKSKYTDFDWVNKNYDRFFVELDYEKLDSSLKHENWNSYHNDIIIPLRDSVLSGYTGKGFGSTEVEINTMLSEHPDILVKADGDKIVGATISDEIINEHFEKSSESEIPESELEEISEGVYKSGDNTYYCNAKVAIEVWGTNVKDAIRAKIVANNSQIDGHYDLYAVIEKYQTDINKIKVFFNSIDSDNKPKSSENYTPWTNIQLKDVEGYETEENTMESDNNVVDQLGGILLRPIFALVNYIADSVMRVTGEIMYPEAYNNETGDRADIMTAGDAVNLGYSKSQKVEVDVSNFKALSKKYYPQFRYTPEEIFSGQVNILSIDFISGKDSDGNTINNTGWTELRKVIAGWYKALRLIAAIGLLSVLIYTGIKIIMSSTARDKAKYKEWIVNWFIAAALLFTMHYIMSFIITVNSEISNLLYTSSTGIEVVPTNDSQGLGIKTFTTNLMGLVRFHILEESFSAKIAYEIMYVALIVYTLKFTFVYLKRVLNMAFLTLIAPIVALTYPIDKMNDGRAQGFEMWLKEYTFNALLQILHFLLYNILISSAIELAANNIIYAIVALGFMNEAERLLKKIFGFDKANGGTVGGMSAITAATVASSFKNLGRLGKGKGGNRQDSASDGKIGDFKPKTVDGTKGLMAESNSPNSGAASGGDSESSNEHPGTENGSSDRDQGNDNPDSETGDNSANLTGQGNDTDTDTEGTANDAGTNGNNGTDAGSNSQGENTEPVQDLAKEKETGRLEKMWNGAKNGAKSLGKAAIRPIYDVDKTGAYNKKRFVRNVARGALGAGMGVAAAAVQAGISITDGKYNPMEAVGAFSAGYAGAGAVANKGAAIGNTFMSGYNSGDNNAKMKQAVEDFKNRDDVIAAFKKKYGDDWKDKRERAANNYYAYGETDVSKMIKNMDNADKLMKSNESWDTNTADTQMRNIEKARKELKDMNMYGKVMNDNEQAEKFIQSQVSDSVSEAQLRTLLAQMKQTK